MLCLAVGDREQVKGQDRASSALLLGFKSPRNPVVLTSPQRQGYRGEMRVMEQLELQTGFCLSHSSQPWGGFVILWGQRSVPFLGSQIEFPDLVVR